MATAAASLLDSETFEASSERDAIGRVLVAISPDDSEVLYSYDEGGGLQKVELKHRGSSTAQTVVGDIAAGAGLGPMSLFSQLPVVFVGVLTIVGCKSRCDPDEIFETDIVGSGWLECGDLHTEADRTEATTCLEGALGDGVPAYIRLSDDRGVQYLYLDEQRLAGVLGWAGRLGRMGDTVQHYHPCDAATAIDAFANHEQINAECSGSGEQLCP